MLRKKKKSVSLNYRQIVDNRQIRGSEDVISLPELFSINWTSSERLSGIFSGNNNFSMRSELSNLFDENIKLIFPRAFSLFLILHWAKIC